MSRILKNPVTPLFMACLLLGIIYSAAGYSMSLIPLVQTGHYSNRTVVYSNGNVEEIKGAIDNLKLQNAKVYTYNQEHAPISFSQFILYCLQATFSLAFAW